ncbi:hypothetical protein D3C87_1781910 [compost metagenome]
MCGNEYDRNDDAAIGEFLLEIQSAGEGKPDIEDQAAGLGKAIVLVEVERGRKCPHAVTDGAKQSVECLPDQRLVIDNQNDWAFRHILNSLKLPCFKL